MGNLNKWYHDNLKMDEKDLPYPIEITSGGNIYYRKNESLRKADFFKFKNGIISVNIEGVEILLKGYDKNKKKFNYEVFDRRNENGSIDKK